MTAIHSHSPIEHIVEHFSGRRTGSGRWVAKCSNHDDRLASLTISAGREGRVLLHCFAGCDLSAILKSAGLKVENLFPAGPRPSLEQLAAIAAERERQREEKQAERAQVREAVDWLRLRYQALDQELPEVGRKLMLMPADALGAEALTAHFHDVLAQLRFIDRTFLGEAEWL